MRFRPGFAAAAALIAVCALPAAALRSAAARQDGAPPAPRLYSLRATGQPVRAVLLRLFVRADVPVAVADDVTGTVTVEARDEPFGSVVRRILRASSQPITYVREDGVFLFKARRHPDPLPPPLCGPPPTPPPTVTLRAQNEPVRLVLARIFDQARVTYSLDNNVRGTVTVVLTDQPVQTALRTVLRAASEPLTYTREEGVYFVKPRPITDPSCRTSLPAHPEPFPTPRPAPSVGCGGARDGS